MYSVLARYHAWSGNKSVQVTLNSLFGTRSVTAIMDLPSHLNDLVNNLPIGSKYNVNDFIYKHTLFPFYEPFLPLDRAKQIYHSMIANSGGNIHTRAGIMASSIALPQYLRYCPKCSEQDFNQYGELYWHRLHQVPGVFVCTVHEIPLQNSLVKIHQQNNQEYFPAKQDNCSFNNLYNEIEPKNVDKLIVLAKGIEWLLGQKIESYNPSWYQERYISLLHKKGMISFNGCVNQIVLANEFTNLYGQDILECLDSEISNDESNWLRLIVRKYRKTLHPIRHILMIQFLTNSIEDFFSNNNFKEDHHREGLWSGFKIKEENYGKLQELSDQNLSLREIARRLNADPNTIKQYTIKLGFQPKWRQKKTKASSHKKSAQYYKNAWLEAQKKYSMLTKTELRKKLRTIYNWLYLNEHEWLKRNSPIRQKRMDKRVDWNLRDQEILKLAKEAVLVMLHREGKPERITIYRVGKMINSLALLEKHIDKLLETQHYLNTVIEDMESFQIRKVRWAIHVLLEKEGCVKTWKVKEMTGLKGDISEMVQIEINS